MRGELWICWYASIRRCLCGNDKRHFNEAMLVLTHISDWNHNCECKVYMCVYASNVKAETQSVQTSCHSKQIKGERESDSDTHTEREAHREKEVAERFTSGSNLIWLSSLLFWIEIIKFRMIDECVMKRVIKCAYNFYPQEHENRISLVK